MRRLPLLVTPLRIQETRVSVSPESQLPFYLVPILIPVSQDN